MTVPNMVRKENGKGIIYEIAMPIAKYIKSRVDGREGNRLLFIFMYIMLSQDLKPHTRLYGVIMSRMAKILVQTLYDHEQTQNYTIYCKNYNVLQ